MSWTNRRQQKATVGPKTRIAKLQWAALAVLKEAGVPLAYVARQLGHANTRMVEAHYAHLCPNALADSIRTLSPKVPVPKQARGRLKV